jgi:hypothetical protein
MLSFLRHRAWCQTCLPTLCHKRHTFVMVFVLPQGIGFNACPIGQGGLVFQ